MSRKRLPESNRCTGFCRPTRAILRSRTAEPSPAACREKPEATHPAGSRRIPLTQGAFGARLARAQRPNPEQPLGGSRKVRKERLLWVRQAEEPFASFGWLKGSKSAEGFV